MREIVRAAVGRPKSAAAPAGSSISVGETPPAVETRSQAIARGRAEGAADVHEQWQVALTAQGISGNADAMLKTIEMLTTMPSMSGEDVAAFILAYSDFREMDVARYERRRLAAMEGGSKLVPNSAQRDDTMRSAGGSAFSVHAHRQS